MNGTSSYIEVVLGSNGINDLISRVENIRRIVTFDQNIIDNLKTKQAAINVKKEALEAGNIKLLALRGDNKKDLATLIKQKSDQDVLSSKLEALEKQYGAQLVIDEAILVRQAIQARKAAEEKQALINSQKAKKQVSNTPQANTPITSNSSDLDLLARLITAEAGGESYNAQVAVGAVVLNRVKSSSFPSSIREVIYQKTYAHYEFTPVLNGNIDRPAYSSAVQAAKEALSGNDPTNNALFFYSGGKPSGLTLPQPVSIIIGNLTFINML
ncbi:cell wall hydrolase [Clostridium lacusfryxellense]|nr:cell wall hydrolase [Clostridium lacusfryxellense]